ncbi:MAG TPA: OmpA family protein [Pyrinomonadaceae bacterium]|nr:OmpA family protein [Pyrinomonadaceae bacterium]
MESKKTQILLIALAITLACSGPVLGQDSAALTVESSVSKAPDTTVIAGGKKAKATGIVINRNGDAFTIRDSRGEETTVVTTDKTKIRLVRKGLFRADRSSNATEILRGLRLEAEGGTNSDGQIVARQIRFDEEDLRTAQALESRVDPVENLAKSTQALAENNQQRIGEAEQNAQRLSGQVDEVSTVANAATSAANNAQSSADQADANATTANSRINQLDDYDVLATIAVHFKNGSARLSPQARLEIDAVADTVSENLNGWLVAVEGYDDSTGRPARNRSLSERRAKAVTDYLVTKHGVPPYRLVQPFGFGSSDPVALNNTRVGRALNRRAEIKVFVNKGISSQGKTQAASQEQMAPRP